MKKRLIVLLLIVLTVLVAGCSAKNLSYEGDSSSDNYNLDSNNLILPEESDRKIVYTITAQIQTEDFNESRQKIFDETLTAQGYIESSNINDTEGNQNASYTLRIKTENLNAFLDKFETFGTVYSQNSYSEDITQNYIDVSAKIDAYTNEIELLEQYCETEEDPSIVFQYTQRISQLTETLSNYQMQLNVFDSMVEYSTVNIYLYGKGTTIPKLSFDNKIEEVFFGSLTVLIEILKFIVLAVIAIAPFAAVGAILYFGIKYLIIYLKKRFPEKFKEKEKIYKQYYSNIKDKESENKDIKEQETTNNNEKQDKD